MMIYLNQYELSTFHSIRNTRDNFLNKQEISQHVTVTQDMVETAKNFLAANFAPQSKTMLHSLFGEQGVKPLEEGRSVEDVGLTISWHNAGLIAIRQLISDVRFIPASSSLYMPRNIVGYRETSGNQMFKETINGTLDLTGMQFPVCELVALNSVGRG